MLVSFGQSVFDPIVNEIDIRAVVDYIKYGLYEKKIQKIRGLADKKKRARLKENLPFFVTATFEPKYCVNRNLKSTSLISFDIDNVVDVNKARQIIENCKYTYVSFLSPSGNGFKVVCKLEKPVVDHKLFTLMFRLYEKMMCVELQHNIDTLPDVRRAIYLSYDPDIYFNEDCTTLPYVTVEPPKVAKPREGNIDDKKLLREAIEVLSGKKLTYYEWVRLAGGLHKLIGGRFAFVEISTSGNSNDSLSVIHNKWEATADLDEIGIGTVIHLIKKYKGEE